MTTNHYLALAEDLRSIADDLARLAGSDLPCPYVRLHIQPARPLNPDADEVRTHVTAVAAALGTVPSDRQMRDGAVHSESSIRRGCVDIDVIGVLQPPPASDSQEQA